MSCQPGEDGNEVMITLVSLSKQTLVFIPFVLKCDTHSINYMNYHRGKLIGWPENYFFVNHANMTKVFSHEDAPTKP